MQVIECLFLIAIFCIVYTYVLYPIVLFTLSAVVQLVRDCRFVIGKTDRRVQSMSGLQNNEHSDHTLPSIGVIIAAYNEEKSIQERIENLLQQSYPQDKLTIYIGSDGSDDKTIEIANAFDAGNLNIFDFQERRGKVSVLNELVETANEDILVFSDANTMFAEDAIDKLARHFDQQDIGAVVGELVLYDPVKQGNQDSAYWQYERLLKFHESRLNGLLGANGAIYAIRKDLYQPLDRSTLIDDFSIVMNICRQQQKAHYDPEAIAYEEVSPTVQSEFGRRVRIGAGNYQAMMEYVDFLNPLKGFRFFTFLSHKVLRWLVPHFMLIALISNILLVILPSSATSDSLCFNYGLLLLGQVIIYGLSLLTHLTIKKWRHTTVLQLMYFMVSMNVALGFGFIRYLKGQSSGTWKRTAR